MLIIIGFLFMVLILAGVGGLAQSLLMLLDVPSALLTLICLLFFLLTSKSGSVIGRYIKSSFKKNYVYTKTELEGLSTAAKTTVWFILGTGGFGFVTGVIGSLANLRDRELLGPNLAISLITVLYSIMVSFFIFFPVQAWAENKINLLALNNEKAG
jgi:flagellar motor component MotA